MLKIFISILLSSIIYAVVYDTGNASEFPNKQIQLIIPYDPGAGTDRVGRLIARLVEPYLGVKIQVINKSGGSGARGFTYVKNSKPDGYVIGMTMTNLATHKIFGNLDFDHHDVETIILFHTDPAFIGVSTKSKFTNLRDFVEEAKKRPGGLSLAASAPGGVSNIASKDFFKQAGIDVKIVPSTGGGVQSTVLVGGGHVDACFASILDVLPQIEAGNVKPLAVYMDQRYDKMSEIPSFVEEGYIPKIYAYRGIIAPKGTPRAIQIKLHDAFKKAADEQAFINFADKNFSYVIYKDQNDANSLYDELQQAATAIVD